VSRSRPEPYSQEWLAARARKRAATQHRKPPMDPGPKPRGTCQWCMGQILYPEGHKKAGELNTSRGWHQGCVGWYRLAAWQSDAANAVWGRADGKCQLCGSRCNRRDVMGWEGLHHRYGGEPRVEWIRWERQDEPSAFWGKPGARGAVQWCAVQPVERALWQADHIVPLWSLPAPLPLEQRGCFFGMANLWLLCTGCYKAKTRREAAARAAVRRNRTTEPPALTAGPDPTQHDGAVKRQRAQDRHPGPALLTRLPAGG
jgi:5-methylcytosine-specific restriction endonuclease McrA